MCTRLKKLKPEKSAKNCFSNKTSPGLKKLSLREEKTFLRRSSSTSQIELKASTRSLRKFRVSSASMALKMSSKTLLPTQFSKKCRGK